MPDNWYKNAEDTLIKVLEICCERILETHTYVAPSTNSVVDLETLALLSVFQYIRVHFTYMSTYMAVIDDSCTLELQ